ncbi:molecular chaperone DnaJ, partial [Candidatus Woesearchaeota archaeon]|nr:molecular chaperone DnaJ [Candidatus Woesearchaeota archaeon]
KKLAKKYHPDVSSSNNTEEKFKEINEAFSVLGNEKKKNNYDRFGSAEGGFGGQGFGGQSHGFGGFDFNDVEDIFSSFFGGGRKRKSHGPQRGSDLQYNLNVSFEDAALGAEHQVSIEKTTKCKSCKGKGAKKPDDVENCSTCDGSGTVTRQTRTPFGYFSQSGVCGTCRGEGKKIKNPCSTCNGIGIVNDDVKIDIKIPEGIRDGTTLKLGGHGDAGIKDGPSGDLYIRIQVSEGELFTRIDDDLYIDAKINFAQAAIGDEIKVPTLKGKVKLKIPSGTQTHTNFRIKDNGIKHLNSTNKGDLYVRVIIETPNKLTKHEKEFYKEYIGKQENKGFFKSLFE